MSVHALICAHSYVCNGAKLKQLYLSNCLLQNSINVFTRLCIIYARMIQSRLMLDVDVIAWDLPVFSVSSLL